MTDHQAKVLEFVRTHIERYGASPSFLEIREMLGIKSVSIAVAVVNALVADGYLRRLGRGRPRSLVLAGANLRAVETRDLIAELKRRGVELG